MLALSGTATLPFVLRIPIHCFFGYATGIHPQRVTDPLLLAKLGLVVDRALMAVSQQLLVEDGLGAG